MDVICKYIYIYDEKKSNIVRNIYYISKINKKIEINNNYKLFIVPIRSILYVYIIIMIVLINEC